MTQRATVPKSERTCDCFGLRGFHFLLHSTIEHPPPQFAAEKRGTYASPLQGGDAGNGGERECHHQEESRTEGGHHPALAVPFLSFAVSTAACGCECC